MMRAISLFTGIGGFDLGFERAGIETVLQCEQDKHCRNILSRHFPGLPIREDIRDVRGKELPAADVLCGGFPCQDLSVAGRRAGLAGERSGLFYEFARIADEAHPKWLVIENVPGLRSSNEGEDLEIILATLGKLGYVGGVATLDAQYFGVPQRRERVFIVGHLGTGIGDPIEVLFESESVCGDSPPSREAGEIVAATLGGSSQHGGFRTTDLDGTTYIVAPFDERGITIKTNRSSVEAGAVYVPEIAYALAAREAKGVSLFEGQSTYVARHRVRRLTPLECERLQGFPDDWTRWGADGSEIADSHRYRMMGNAVAVPGIEWLGHRIMATEKARVTGGEK